VEVVLAIGIVSFAFVAILGLLPAGMTQFRKAIDTSVAADIAQRVIDDAQQSDWDTLTSIQWPAYRYFDERGEEIIPQNTGAATNANLLNQQTEAPKVVYQVATRIVPQTIRPDGGQGTKANPNTLATLTVQVLNNPGFSKVQTDNSTPPLIIPYPGYSVITFCAQITPSSFSTNTNTNSGL